MSTILYEWEFANYICRVVESEPGIVHFEQARKESGGDPRVMEFRRTATPMGAANEIIQLHQAHAEAKMLNRDLAAFYQGYQEDRNRREQRIDQLEACVKAADISIPRQRYRSAAACAFLEKATDGLVDGSALHDRLPESIWVDPSHGGRVFPESYVPTKATWRSIKSYWKAHAALGEVDK